MLIVWGGAGAAELAYTVRPTELKAKPFSDASTLAHLAASSKVDVLGRQASWVEVHNDGARGYVKMLSLRMAAIGANPKAGGANDHLAVLLNVAQTGKGGSAATTGVKGMSAQLLANPRPNPQALEQMMAYKATPEQVEQFAHTGKLVSTDMDYLAPVRAGEQP
jgi:hypothetical protein